jgi:hypothetical protein
LKKEKEKREKKVLMKKHLFFFLCARDFGGFIIFFALFGRELDNILYKLYIIIQLSLLALFSSRLCGTLDGRETKAKKKYDQRNKNKREKNIKVAGCVRCYGSTRKKR